MRPYRLGLVLGRFQGLHIGHEAIIRRALAVCDQVIVMIGSADKEGTSHDPFPVSLRKKMLQAMFPHLVKSGRVILVPLNDLGVRHQSDAVGLRVGGCTVRFLRRRGNAVTRDA